MTEVSFSYNALEKIDTPMMDFQVLIRDQKNQNAVVLRTPVGNKSPFEIITSFVPTRAMTEENVNCSITFKYLGKETASRVRARLNVDGQPVHTVDLGSLSKDTTKTQSLFAKFDKAGTYVVELYLDYQDAESVEQSVLVGTGLVEVRENNFPVNPNLPNSELQQEINNQINRQSDSTKVLIVSGTLIVVIFLAIVVLIKKKK